MMTPDYQALLNAVLAELSPGHVGPTPEADRLANDVGALLQLWWANVRRLEPHFAWYLRDSICTTEDGELWSFNGRHAPLTSVDCALSVPLPEGYIWERIPRDGMEKEIAVSALWFDVDTESWEPIATFSYTAPRALPVVLCMAVKAAWEHAKENR